MASKCGGVSVGQRYNRIVQHSVVQFLTLYIMVSPTDGQTISIVVSAIIYVLLLFKVEYGIYDISVVFESNINLYFFLFKSLVAWIIHWAGMDVLQTFFNIVVVVSYCNVVWNVKTLGAVVIKVSFIVV